MSSKKSSDGALPPYEFMLDSLYKELSHKKAATGERFKMPEVEASMEGNKTVFRNFVPFCERIRREPEFVAKFISKELGAPVRLDGKRLVIQKRVKPELLQKKMELFVNHYVLCHECGRPDTTIVTIEGIHYLVCEACGARRPLKK